MTLTRGENLLIFLNPQLFEAESHNSYATTATQYNMLGRPFKTVFCFPACSP